MDKLSKYLMLVFAVLSALSILVMASSTFAQSYPVIIVTPTPEPTLHSTSTPIPTNNIAMDYSEVSRATEGSNTRLVLAVNATYNFGDPVTIYFQDFTLNIAVERGGPPAGQPANLFTGTAKPTENGSVTIDENNSEVTFQLTFVFSTLQNNTNGQTPFTIYELVYSGNTSTTSLSSSPSVPEFTLNYVDHSYDVPPEPATSTDPFTGIVTSTTIPGYHVENKTIEVRIQNNIGASYYGLRYKGHYDDNWNFYPYNGPNDHNLMDWFSVPFNASNSGYTTVAFVPPWFVETIPVGGEVDVQVQALFGEYEVTPYGHVIDVGGPTYDFVFKGTAGEFSSTQTIKIPTVNNSTTPTPSSFPSVPEFLFMVLLLLFVVVSFASVVILRKRLSKGL